ncbi:MAG: PGF-pre-PGF domain-containing protein [Candidatus Aenigmatarchaeota archaeon]
MRKALIGAAKISAALGALALVLAFLGFYVMPGLAAQGDSNGPQFFFNATSNTSYQFSPLSNYGFQVNITNETNGFGVISNVTFMLGSAVGTLTNYTKATTIAVSNNTALWTINFTQEQLGPAGSYNYTWYANDTQNRWNKTANVSFTVAVNTTNQVSLWFMNTTNNLLNTNATAAYYIYPSTINITSYSIYAALPGTSGIEINLYLNNTTAVNSLNYTNATIPAGINEIVANTSGNANFSANARDFFINITQNTTNQVQLWFMNTTNNVVNTNMTAANYFYPNNVNITAYNIFLNSGTITLYLNNTTTITQNNTNATLPAGINNIVANTSGNANYSANAQNFFINITQNTSMGAFLYLNGVSANLTYARSSTPITINATRNTTPGGDDVRVTIFTNFSGTYTNITVPQTVTPPNNVTNVTNTRNLGFGIYRIDANVSAGQNYSASASNYTLYLTLNSSTINFILNLTYVNSSGYVSNLNSLAAFSPQFLAQEVFTASETGCGHANMTVNFTMALGGVATIPVNNTCNYTVTVTMADVVSLTDQVFNSTFVINKLNMISGTGDPIYADIQLVPMGLYGKASPSLKSILGGFAFNDTNIRATSSYQNITFAIARRGYMPDGLWQCGNWNQSTVGENKQACSSWSGSATAPMTDTINPTTTNTTYLNKTIGTQNFVFYGYSEPFYNLRPLVKAYGNASNITSVNILNWGNQRAKYYSWVPMVKFNMTSKQAYLPSSDAYADAMYYDVPFFANPSAIEMLAYNFTVNVSFATQAYNQTFGVSITPRIIRSGQTLLSGAETPLMPAWSVQDTDSFQGGSVTRTILRPTFNTLYYTYNGTTCGPYLNQSNIGPGSNARVNFYNVSMAFPCNQNLSYDYSTNEMNFTVSNENVTNPSLSVLFALAGRQTEGMYSPVYLVNQTFLGGFIPGPGQTPPSPGTASTITFVVKVNNSLSNFTTAAGSDLMIHFLYPKNVTLWDNSSTSDVNMTANMGSGFQLWQLNDTINAAVADAVNASASGDVNTSTGKVWMMIANETVLWNATTLTYNVTNPSSFFVNRTTSCNNVTENFSGSPANGKNITICFQEFDFNLTAINGWLPNDPKSNVTLNLTATLNVSILNEIKRATGAAGSTNQYNASISTASAGEIKLGDTQLPGFNAANCGSDFSNCSKTVMVDGSVLNTSSYRTGSIILNLGSGTHAVSVSYNVPAAAAAAAATTSSGSSSTTVSDVATGKVTKTFTSIAPYAARTITESELTGTNTGLTQIDISVKNIATDVKITVEKLAGKPASITQEAVSTNGMVYKFMNISKENLADKDIEKAKIRFKIEKSWLSANNFSALQIVMKRYTAQWDSLNTSMTSEDTSYAYYSADSPGFSVFAVAADKNVVTPVAPEQPMQPQQPLQEIPQQQQSAGTPLNMTIVYMVIAIVAILGGVLFMEMKKEKSDKKKK